MYYSGIQNILGHTESLEFRILTVKENGKLK